jgi:hypothetical protein
MMYILYLVSIMLYPLLPFKVLYITKFYETITKEIHVMIDLFPRLLLGYYLFIYSSWPIEIKWFVYFCGKPISKYSKPYYTNDNKHYFQVNR